MYYLFFRGRKEDAERFYYYYFLYSEDSDVDRLCLCIGILKGYFSHYISNEELWQNIYPLADGGHPAAQYEYATLLRRGKYYSNALDFYMRSYKSGYLLAAKVISDMYMSGEITGKRDKKKAAEPDISEDDDPSAYDIEIDERVFNDRETDEQSDVLLVEKKSGKIKKILKKFFKAVGIIILILFILLVLILII